MAAVKNNNGGFKVGNKAAVGRKGKTPLNAEAKKQLMTSAPEIMKKAIALALEGDTSMITLLVNKIMPTQTLVQQDLNEKLESLLEAKHENN